MTKQTENDRDDAGRLKNALTLYRSLSDALAAAITRLRVNAEGDKPDTGDAASLVKQHQKALQTVLDIETRYEEHRYGKQGGEQSRLLNLKAARDEVLGRLARLRPAG